MDETAQVFEGVSPFPIPQLSDDGDGSHEQRDDRILSLVRAEQVIIAKARINPAYFILYLTERDVPDHHIDWLKRFLNPYSNRILIIAPRESAKTTLVAYFLAWWIGKNPVSSNIFCSVSASQAKDRLSMVRSIISSERFKRVFPGVEIDSNRPNNSTEFSVWASLTADGVSVAYTDWLYRCVKEGDPKNPTLFGAGITSKGIIGRRFSGLAVVDDPHDTQTSSTVEQCDKTQKYFNENILGGVQNHGKVIVISTRWSEYDLAGRLKEQRDDSNRPIWSTAELSALDEYGKSYWSEWWSEDRLYQKRQEVGEVMWQTMYMNNPIGASSLLFARQHLANPLPDPLPQFYKLVVSIDLSETTNRRSDFSVLAVMARDQKRPYNVYLLDLIRFKKPLIETVETIQRFCDEVLERYRQLDGVLFESPANNTQAMLVKTDRPDLPVREVAVKGSKTDRLMALSSVAQSGRLFVNQSMPTLPAVISELLGYPKSKHDDIPDACSLPFQWSFWKGVGSVGYVRIPMGSYRKL